MLHGGVSTAMDFTEIMSLYVTAAWSFAHFWLWKESSYILDFGLRKSYTAISKIYEISQE
jgi:hypothetical protein